MWAFIETYGDAVNCRQMPTIDGAVANSHDPLLCPEHRGHCRVSLASGYLRSCVRMRGRRIKGRRRADNAKRIVDRRVLHHGTPDAKLMHRLRIALLEQLSGETSTRR